MTDGGAFQNDVRIHGDNNFRRAPANGIQYHQALANIGLILEDGDAMTRSLSCPTRPFHAVIGRGIINNNEIELFDSIVLIHNAEYGFRDTLSLVVHGHNHGYKRVAADGLQLELFRAQAAQETSEKIPI